MASRLSFERKQSRPFGICAHRLVGDLEEAPRINPGLLFLTPPQFDESGRTAARESFCPFGTFDFHTCWLRTISERQQKWLALKLSFPRPPSRVLPRERFSPAPSGQSASRSFSSRLG